MTEEKIFERVATAESEISNQKEWNKTFCAKQESMGKDIKEIREALLGRPSWPVATLLAGLTGACGTMATFIFSKIL